MTLPSAHVSMFIYHARHCIVPGILRYQTIIFEKCAAKREKTHFRCSRYSTFKQIFFFKIVLMVKQCICGDFSVEDQSHISHHFTVHIMVVTGSD